MRNGVSSLWDSVGHKALDREDGDSGLSYTGDVGDRHIVRADLNDFVAKWCQAIIERADLETTSDILHIDRLANFEGRQKSLPWFFRGLASDGDRADGHQSQTNQKCIQSLHVGVSGDDVEQADVIDSQRTV